MFIFIKGGNIMPIIVLGVAKVASAVVLGVGGAYLLVKKQND